MNRESIRFMCQHGTDTRTGECPRCASDRSDRSDRMTLIAACLRYVDAGKEVPKHLRVRLDDHDWGLVLEYRDHFRDDLDCRR